MKKYWILITILGMIVVRAIANLLLPAPYLFYDEQIYFWIARHYEKWSSFHCGHDVFPRLRVLYQWLISPVCGLSFQTAFRSIQLINWGLFAITLTALLFIFQNSKFKQHPPAPLQRETNSKFKICFLSIIAAGLSSTFWVSGQIMPENLMLAAGACSLLFLVLSDNSKKKLFKILWVCLAIFMFGIAFFAKPHIAIILPVLLAVFLGSKFGKWWWWITGITCAIVGGLIVITFVASGSFPKIVEMIFHSSKIRIFSVPKFFSSWGLNFLRYMTLPIIVCGILPPIALLIKVQISKSKIQNFTFGLWVISAIIVSWFATWRNITYWQPDIFERYFGIALPLIAGVGIMSLMNLEKISRKKVAIIIFSILPGLLFLIPVIAKRTDENAPGTLFFYLLANNINVYVMGAVVCTTFFVAVFMLLKSKTKQISVTFVVMAILFVASGWRLSSYSSGMKKSGQEYWKMIEENCTDDKPIILLSVGVQTSWLHSKLRAENLWIEYDVTGISNQDIMMQLSGNTMVAGEKWVIAPVWYKLDFLEIAKTNGYILYRGKSKTLEENPKDFVDSIEGIMANGKLSLTNVYKFNLPGTTNLTAQVGIEIRTDNVSEDITGKVSIVNFYDVTEAKTKKLQGQCGINCIARRKLHRPDKSQPFAVKIILDSTNWPVLRAWTDFPLPD